MIKQIIALFLLSVITSLSFAGADFTSADSTDTVRKLITFLTADWTGHGVTYMGTAGDLMNRPLPLTYYAPADYWGKYVCEMPGNDCHVTDIYHAGNVDADNSTLLPDPASPGAALQSERALISNGTDIYDAATWQIALALASQDHQFNDKNLFSVANDQNILLQQGFSGEAFGPLISGGNRILTDTPAGSGDSYHSPIMNRYFKTAITDRKKAYFPRMVTRQRLLADPFVNPDTRYLLSYITAPNLPTTDLRYKTGLITVFDNKPVTGENVWAFLIGPLQAAQIKYKRSKAGCVPYHDIAVQNALDILFAFQAMQSPLGCLYYTTVTDGSPENYVVSIENNASALAGLLTLQHVLMQTKQYDTSVSPDDKISIDDALSKIDIMLRGGMTISGDKTEGLIHFFRHDAYATDGSATEVVNGGAWDRQKQLFVIGGKTNDNGDRWTPGPDVSVDANTWTVSVLGQPLIDQWFGFGTAYQIWKNVRALSSYSGNDHTLWGVGYSANDDHDVMSAEWTAGAINMLRVLITQYKTAADSSSQYTAAQKAQATQIVEELQADHDSMVDHLARLRSDQYGKDPTFDEVRPFYPDPDYYSKLFSAGGDTLSYVYASKRYLIRFPGGWFANPIPSTASTTWPVMLYYQFNPFNAIDGGYEPNQIADPLIP